MSQKDIKEYADAIADKWTGKFGKYDVKTEVQILEGKEGANILDAQKEGFNIINFIKDDGRDPTGTTQGRTKNVVDVKISTETKGNQNTKRTTQHEAGHVMGDIDISQKGNIMRSGNKLDLREEVNYSVDNQVQEHNISTIISNRKVNDVTYDPNYTGQEEIDNNEETTNQDNQDETQSQ